MTTLSQSFQSSPRYQSAKQELLNSIAEASAKIQGIRPCPSPQAREEYLAEIQKFQKNRGRDLYFPYLASGLGSGPWVELADGSVKYDMITGIGINFFGHSNPDLMGAQIDGLASNPWQGNLQPGVEARDLLEAILPKAAIGSRLKNGWLTTCGTMANEIALKIIRQKKAPATKIVAFQDCFLGRSTAMQEITDNPSYRVGQPLYGEVLYLPFYDPKLGLEKSVQATLTRLKEHVSRYGDRLAALEIELIQGEGGFNFAPREWYVRVFEEAKKAGMAIWIDEIQTFGRTGEYFAFQKFCLGEYADVVTVAKMLQTSIVFYTEEYNPKPGLVAGTFSGPSGALAAAKKVVEVLDRGGYLGVEGKIAHLSKRFEDNLKRLSETTCRGKIGEIRVLGGMIAFQPLDGKMEQIKAILLKLFDLGVVAFYCGHGPYLVRMLPPLGAMKDAHVDEVCNLIEKALGEVS